MEQDSLFQIKEDIRPLADRMRPETLEEYVGQHQLVEKGKLLWQMIIFHDIGKCNPNFQRKKMKNNDDSIPESLKGLSGTEHSFLSSILYLDYFFDLLEKEETFEKKEKKKI